MSAKHHVTIDPEVRAVLVRATMNERAVYLPEQLDRALYQRVDKALRAAGGRWDRKAKAHVFDVDPRVTFAQVDTMASVERRQQALQAFFTPPAEAERIVELAGIERHHRCLEPSAGMGALVDAMVRREPRSILAIDIDEHHVRKLMEAHVPRLSTVPGRVEVMHVDFLSDRVKLADFDRIVMNPPFADGAEVLHVRRAHSMLARDGVLVTVLSGAYVFRETGHYRGFEHWLRGHGELVRSLPRGTFDDTDVGTCVWRLRA